MRDRELLARIVEASGDAIISVGTDGLITSWNDGAEQLFGYTADETVGRPLLMLAPPDGAARMSALIATAIAGEHLTPYETVRLRKDGRAIPVSVTVAPLRDASGQVVGAGAIMRDIARETREREELARSRERLAVSQQVAHVGSWEWDLRSDVVTWSAELYRLFGQDPREFTPSPQSFTAQLHPDDRDGVVALVHRAIAERHGFSYEARAVLPDGSVRVIGARGEVALGDDLSVARVYGIGQDITDQRTVADRLRREKETLELVGRATNDVIWDWDFRTGRVQRGPGLDAYGYERDDPDDPDWWASRVHPDDLPGVTETITAALEGGQPIWSAAFRFRRADGTYASVVDRGHIVRDADGKAIRMVGSLLDVTERDRAQEVARRSAASAELLSRASHELRTPLNAILGFSELLEQRLESVLGPRERRYVQNIRGSGGHLLNLVDRLLQVATAGGGRLELRPATVSLRLLVEPVLADLQESATAAGVGLHAAEIPEAMVSLDRERIATVLHELVQNALGATPAGGSVIVSAAVPEGDLVIEVSDTGRGIPEEAHDRIFGVFERIHEDRRDEATGLGLALCRELVERHGGAISFDSAPGNGSTFRIRIPGAVRADGHDAAVVGEGRSDGEPAAAGAPMEGSA